MHFISIVGTQVMAVINPVLALKKAGHCLERVHLLATAFTRDKAVQVREFFVDQGFSPEAVVVRDISDSTATDDQGRPPAHEALGLLHRESGPMVFNLAGGMNFQVAACVGVLPGADIGYVYPENNGVHMFAFAGGKLTQRVLLPLPPPLDVLRIQGIESTLDKTQVQQTARDFLQRFSLANRPDLQTNVLINDVLFDAVWNAGNVLHFLKVLAEPPSMQWKDKKWLEEARKVLNLALQRVTLKELHHREILLLCRHPLVVERVNTEGQGKVKALLVPKRMDQIDFQVAVRDALRGLPVDADLPGPVTETCSTSGFRAGRTLLTVLGRDPSPTLTALWTHRPETVELFSTPGDDQVAGVMKTLREHAKLIPCRTLTLRPVDLAGLRILDTPRPELGAMEVNITPGGKGHAGVLALWARMHDATCYSLDSRAERLTELPRGEARPLRVPGPPDMLKLSGCNVRAYGVSKGSLLQKSVLYDGLTRFLSALSGDPDLLARFPQGRLECGGMAFEAKGDKATLLLPDAAPLAWSLAGGQWIEELAGYALAMRGADEVQVRIRTDWSDRTQEHLQARHGVKGHMTDIDVVARFRTRYYVISCKQKQGTTGAATREIKAMAALFGRFAYPLLFQLKYAGEPSNASNDVWKFGVATLTDPTALGDLLAHVARSKSTRR